MPVLIVDTTNEGMLEGPMRVIATVKRLAIGRATVQWNPLGNLPPPAEPLARLDLRHPGRGSVRALSKKPANGRPRRLDIFFRMRRTNKPGLKLTRCEINSLAE